MPITKSAIKRARQNVVRMERLKPHKSYMKTMIRKIHELSKSGKKDDVLVLLPEVFSAIDTACKKKIIRNNNAARKKAMISRLAFLS